MITKESDSAPTIAPSLTAGILLMLLASLFFAMMGAFVKVASKTVPFFEVAFFRSLISFLLLASFIRFKKIPIKATNWTGIFIRSVSGCAAFVCYFYALSRINLADAVLLNYTSPIFTVLLAAVFLGEALTGRVLSYLGVAFLGVILVLKPTGDFASLGGIAGLLSGFLAAIAYVQVKQLSKSENSWTIVFFFTLLSTGLTLPFLLIKAVWPSPMTWLALFGVGASGAIAQMCMTASYRRAPASLGSIVSLTTVLIAAVFGLCFFREGLDSWSILGGLLILLSSAFIYVQSPAREPTAAH